MDAIINFLVKYNLIDIAYALALFLIGWSLISWLKRSLPKWLSKVKLDETLKPFLSSLIVMTLKILLIIAVIQKIGIETTSIIAVLGAASLAIGLAFQGTLSNFASGIMLLTLRPFRVGDFVEAAGFAGTVEGIHIFNTYIATPDNKVAIIPNSLLFNGSILNYSLKPTRRIELLFMVPYSVSIDHCKASIISQTLGHQQVLRAPDAVDPTVTIVTHAQHGIQLALKAWVKSEDYWPVHYELLEQIKERLEKESIPVPYPQFDMHVIQAKE